MLLLADEHRPAVLTADPPSLVVWSSIWTSRPDAVLRFDLTPAGGGTALHWTLSVDDPLPDDAMLGHLRRRVNELINAGLRLSFGQ